MFVFLLMLGIVEMEPCTATAVQPLSCLLALKSTFDQRPGSNSTQRGRCERTQDPTV